MKSETASDNRENDLLETAKKATGRIYLVVSKALYAFSKTLCEITKK